MRYFNISPNISLELTNPTFCTGGLIQNGDEFVKFHQVGVKKLAIFYSHKRSSSDV